MQLFLLDVPSLFEIFDFGIIINFLLLIFDFFIYIFIYTKSDKIKGILCLPSISLNPGKAGTIPVRLRMLKNVSNNTIHPVTGDGRSGFTIGK